MTPVTGGTSIWMSTSPGVELPVLESDLEVDVCIVGGGMTGLLCAWELIAAGRSAVVIEQRRIAASVTGFTTSKLTSQHGLKYSAITRTRGAEAAHAYGDVNQRALERIFNLVAQLNIDADLERRDAYVYASAPQTRDAVRAEARDAAAAGLPASFTDDVPLPFATAGAVVFSGQAQLHPRKLLLPLAQALIERGCPVFEQSKATGVTPGMPFCTVELENGARVRAKHVVLATLAPSPLGRELWRHLYCHQGYAVAAPVDGPDPLPTGVFINADRPMRSLRTIESAGDTRLLQVGGSAWVANPATGDTPWDDLDHWAQEHFSTATSTYRWTTQDYSSTDDMPLIGALPNAPQVLVATGFGGWGLTTAGVAAELAADVIDGRTKPWHKLFDPARDLPVMDPRIVSSHRTGLQLDPRATLASLPPGGAIVLPLDGEEVAAYRDPGGKLHTVSAVCPHLGCIVLWDPAQTHWACPCHGSTFAPDGAVTHGPARESLPPRA